jgi:hypothetical protein
MTMTISVLIVTILTSLSFGAIELAEYGILHSKLYKDIDGANVQEGSLQFIGPFKSMIKSIAIIRRSSSVATEEPTSRLCPPAKFRAWSFSFI